MNISPSFYSGSGPGNSSKYRPVFGAGVAKGASSTPHSDWLRLQFQGKETEYFTCCPGKQKEINKPDDLGLTARSNKGVECWAFSL